MLFLCNAEAAGFEPANRLRAVNCFRGSLLQPLGHASCYSIGTLSQTISIPPPPPFKGAIRACGLSIAAVPALPASYGPASDDLLMIYLNPPNPLFKGAHQAFVRTRARGHRFAVLRPASDDALLFIGTLSQTLALRAAFTSSTYLLSQIPGPGRSSDDDLLNSPAPLFKGAIRACGLSIATVPALPANSGPASDDLSQSP